ncbi:MAG: ATPase P, partial [Roseiflexaceae bacterium]
MSLPNTYAEQHAAFQLDDIHCPECADAVEQALRGQLHITSVHLDWSHNVVHVAYHPDLITRDAIERVIAGTGCACGSADGSATTTTDHALHVQPSEARRLQRLQHAVDVQPITMGTKHDRMQYEMAATAARPARESAPSVHTQPADHTVHGAMDPAPVDHAAMGHDTGGMDHAAMGHDMGGMDHAAMGHDMSDPGMAAAMERDMRTKFLLALPLTILTVLYSPMGPNMFGITLPTFGIDMNLLMLILTTPVVWYCGWMFISGAYSSLRHRMLNMSVLIAVGVLAAYVGSILLMLLGGETFFEAAAMLVTFVLFGHWMEMRSRRGTNEALRALFDLVPPQATVLRDGAEITSPSSAVQVDNIVILKPGDKAPVDGIVTEGESSIDESLVTGESVPVTKRPGDTVIAGSINRSGSLRFRATK